MTFRGRASKGNSQSQARNSFCVLATIAYAITDPLRRSYTRDKASCGLSLHELPLVFAKIQDCQIAAVR